MSITVTGVVACWGIFTLAWVAGAVYNHAHAPTWRNRSPFGAAMLAGVLISALLIWVVPDPVWRALTAGSAAVRMTGLAVLIACTVVTLWARVVLGTMWSVDPAIRQDHELRTAGPYRFVRHPIYTGMLGMIVGTVLLAGAGQWLTILPVGWALLKIKIRVEERLMTAEFPDEYAHYRRRVPQLIPGAFLFRRVFRRGRPTPGSPGRPAQAAGQPPQSMDQHLV